MAYQTLALRNLTELKARRGSALNPTLASIMGINYPIDEDYIVYEWQESATTTPDDYEVVGSNLGSPDFGRWMRVNLATNPQVNSDWSATSGAAVILNKPTIPAVQVSADWTAISGFTQILNKPTIPAAQVNADWNSQSGIAQIINKPSFSTVATSGSYSDLSGKPSLSAVATSGSYSDLTGKPALSAVAISGSYSDLSGKPSIPAAQVNADWSAVSGVTNILNKPSFAAVATTGVYADLVGKPTLSTVAGSGSYNDLTDKPTIPSAITFSAPDSKTVAKATAYQSGTPAKPAIVTLTLTSTSSVSLAGSVNNTANIVIGSTSAVATGTGTTIAKYSNVLGGTLVIGLNLSTTQTNTYTINLPIGWYYAIVVTTGTGLSVDSAFEQVVG